MPDDDDDVRLPKPPPPLTPPEPQVLPPIAPSFAPEFPSGFRSLRVDASLPPLDEPPYEDASRRMPHGPPPPSSSGSRSWMFMIAMMVVALFGLLGFLLLLGPTSPHAAQGTSVTGTEQTIELPAGQHLVSAEIGDGGQVYYRYTPAQSGAELRSSTLEGRSSTGTFLGRVRFIERAAE